MSPRLIVMLGTATTTKGGVAAAIASFLQSGLFRDLPVLHLPTHTDGGRGAKLRIMLAALGRFVPLLIRGRVGLVHAHSASDASFWRKSAFIALALLFRRPVIFHLHGGGFLDFYRHRAGPVGRGVIRWVLSRSRIVVLSDRWAARLTEITKNQRIVVIPNMIDPASFAMARRGRGYNVLFLGRLEKEKGVYDLLAAAAEIKSGGTPIRLMLAGEGDAAAVKQRAAELGLESVELLGWVSGGGKMSALQRANLFVLPSYIENMPVSILEAMAAGLPIVATGVGGIPDIVEDGVSGILVAPGDRPALAAALRRLLQDEALRNEMGEAAIRAVEARFSRDKVVPRLEALYRELGMERWGRRDAGVEHATDPLPIEPRK